MAYDVYMHVDGRYGRRARTYAVAATVIIWLWIRGVRHLMAHDPTLDPRRKARWRDLVRTARMGLSPSYLDIVGCGWRYLRPSYHPSQEGSTDQAVAYLAMSPAALAADGLSAGSTVGPAVGSAADSR